MWNKKHDNFVLNQKKNGKSIPPSAQLIWRFYERRRRQLGEEMDIDLEECNKWIARQKGSGFDRKTLRNAIALLESVGVITIVKKYHNWRDFRIILHGIEYIGDRHKIVPKNNRPNREKFTPLPDREILPEPNRDNDSDQNSHSKEYIKQQQPNTFHQIDQLTRSVGLVFDRKALANLVRYGVDRVKGAIDLLKLRSMTNRIGNPHGFIVSATRFNWFEKRNVLSGDSLETGLENEISAWVFDLVRAWFPKRNQETLEITREAIHRLEDRLRLEYHYADY